MNQEFVLPATSGLARRLRHVASISDTEIDAGIAALADQGRLSEAQLTALGVPAVGPDLVAATEKLMDQNLRGVLLCFRSQQAPMVAVLAAAILTNRLPLVVITYRPREWTQLAAQFGKTCGIKPTEAVDVLFCRPETVITRDVITEERRAGTLVIQAGSLDERLSNLHGYCANVACEFPHTVVLTEVGTTPVWCSEINDAAQHAAQLLDQDVPAALFTQLKGMPTKGLNGRGFQQAKRRDIYQMLGIVSDLLGEIKSAD